MPIVEKRKRSHVLRHLIRGGSPTQQKKWAVHEASSGQLELETVRTVQYKVRLWWSLIGEDGLHCCLLILICIALVLRVIRRE